MNQIYPSIATFLLLILCNGTSLMAQSTPEMPSPKPKRHYEVQLSYQNGRVFPTNRFLAGGNAEATPINAFESFALHFGNQTSGKFAWESLYDYPYWGGGVALFNFYDPEELGTPVSLFGFFNAPFRRWGKLSLNYNIELGLTFNWRPFNPVNNSNNISIGAGRTVHIGIGTTLNYQLNARLTAILGLELNHFSNGALKQPNYGINTAAPQLRLRYRLRKDDLVFQKHSISPFSPQFEWNCFIFGGAKNVIFNELNVDIIEKYEGVQFPIFGISTSINRQISHKSKFGLGLTLDFDGSHNAQVAIEEGDIEVSPSPFVDKWQLSLSPGYELVIDRFSILLQPSFYLYRKKILDLSPNFYQRIGLKYYVNQRYYVGINLRAFNFRVSDFIEWHVGHRLVWR